MGSSPCTSSGVGEIGRQGRRRRLGRPAAGEQGQRAAAGRGDQRVELVVQRRLGLGAAAVGQVAGHVEQGVGAVVEGAADVELVGREAAPGRAARPGAAARWRWSGRR